MVIIPKLPKMSLFTFKKTNKLNVTGEVDFDTWNVLFSIIANEHIKFLKEKLSRIFSNEPLEELTNDSIYRISYYRLIKYMSPMMNGEDVRAVQIK